MRYAIINPSTNQIVNVVKYDNPPPAPLPGFDPTFIAVANDNVGTNWTFNGSSLIDPATVPQTITPVHVQSERSRRFALGFDYDFQDARGVHRIGTTRADMEGWDDVTKLANALIDVGDTQTQISIVTDTGPTQVTAPEWQAVILYGAQIRQVIWAKSFALQAMSPIPSDYANDAYWT
jgi:hypothetical protein